MDAEVRSEATNVLAELFQNVGRQAQGQGQPDQGGGGMLGGIDIAQELQEFATMPVELAVLFMDMSVELAELVLTTLLKAGYTLAKGLTPA